MDLSVTVDNADVVLKALGQLEPDVMNKVMDQLGGAANETLDDATAACAYDEDNKEPGHVHLRDTGKVEKVDNGYNVTFGEGLEDGGDRAWHIELGTVKMASQPFLFPAFFTNASDVIDRLEGILG